MPGLTQQAESYTTPTPVGKAGRAGVPINTPTPNMDKQLRAKQRQNELRAFLFYEAKLSAAYRQAAYARIRYSDQHHSRGASLPVQIDCE